MAERKDPYREYVPFKSPYKAPNVSEEEKAAIVAQRPTNTWTDVANKAIDAANWLATRQVRQDMPAKAAPIARLDSTTPQTTAVTERPSAITSENFTPVPPSVYARQAPVSAPPVGQAAQRDSSGIPPGFIEVIRGTKRSYFNPETRVEAPTAAIAETLSRPAPKTYEEWLQRAAMTASDPRSYMASLQGIETGRRTAASQQTMASIREAELNRRVLNDQLGAIDAALNPDISKGQKAPSAQERESLLARRQQLQRLQAILVGLGADGGMADGGIVGVPGYADGGEVFMEEDMDIPMAIDPTAAGAAASMESGDYVFPVEAVQFYGLKMLKDMVKRAMTAE